MEDILGALDPHPVGGGHLAVEEVLVAGQAEAHAGAGAGHRIVGPDRVVMEGVADDRLDVAVARGVLGHVVAVDLSDQDLVRHHAPDQLTHDGQELAGPRDIGGVGEDIELHPVQDLRLKVAVDGPGTLQDGLDEEALDQMAVLGGARHVHVAVVLDDCADPGPREERLVVVEQGLGLGRGHDRGPLAVHLITDRDLLRVGGGDAREQGDEARGRREEAASGLGR